MNAPMSRSGVWSTFEGVTISHIHSMDEAVKKYRSSGAASSLAGAPAIAGMTVICNDCNIYESVASRYFSG